MNKYFTTFGITLITIFYSERLFWGNFRSVEDSFENFVWLTIFYYLLSFAFLYSVSCQSKLNNYKIFLSGLIFALMAEVIAAGVLFSNPTSLFFSIPFHTIVTILFGFVIFPKLLSSWHPFKITLLMIASGLAHGLWSFGWSALEPNTSLSFTNYIPHIFISTTLLIIGYASLSKFSLEFSKYTFKKTEFTVLFLLLTILAALHYGFYIIIIIPLIGISLYALQRLLNHGLQNNLTDRNISLPVPIPVSHLLLVMIFPLFSSLSAWYWYTLYKTPFEIHYVFLLPLVLYFIFKFYRIIFFRKW